MPDFDANPQSGITNAINQSLQLQYQRQEAQQQAAARQQQIDVANREADTAAQRLAIESPGLTAQGQLLQQQLDLHKKILQGFDTDHPDSQQPLSAQHIYDVAGKHAVIPVDQLNISKPLEQNLSQPVPPQSGPSNSQPPLDVYQRHAIAIGNAIGGFNKSESQDVELAHAKFASNPTQQGLNDYQTALSAIVKRRDDPDYQKQLDYERAGLSEYAAKRAVIKDNAAATALSKLENDPSALAGANAASAAAQLANLAKQNDLSPETQQRIANLQDVVAQAAKNATKTEYESWREAYKREHNGNEPSAKAVQDFKTAGQTIVMNARGDLQTRNYLNLDTNEMEALTPNEFNAKPQGTYVVYDSATQRANGAHGLINGIRNTINNLNTQLADPNFDSKLDKGTTALLGAALRATDATAYSTAIGKIAMENLTQPQQEYINQLLQLHERAMSLRSLQAAGAGSDQSRDAIFRTLPGLVDNKASAQLKLKALSNELGNVEASFPKIGRSNQSAGERRASQVAAPSGASDEVYDSTGKTLLGHVVNGAYVPLAGGK
jgi:hypothetical protein